MLVPLLALLGCSEAPNGVSSDSGGQTNTGGTRATGGANAGGMATPGGAGGGPTSSGQGGRAARDGGAGGATSGGGALSAGGADNQVSKSGTGGSLSKGGAGGGATSKGTGGSLSVGGGGPASTAGSSHTDAGPSSEGGAGGAGPYRPPATGGSSLPDTGKDGSPRPVTVDAKQAIGTIRPLFGAHHDPGASGQALSKAYAELGLDLMRTHDAAMMGSAAGAGDIDGASGRSGVMFPNWDADATAAASYNFGPTDKVIQNIRAIGAEVFFRVGRSAEGMALMSGTYKNNYAPKDADKYAEIVKHVVMHYNQGWANGFQYGIRYFEFWNEPDFVPFWGGTPQQFYELYNKTAKAIKSVDSSLLVGAPANMSFNDKAGMRASFLEYVNDNKLPLDFYSFHRYTNSSNDPFDFVRVAQSFRDELDQFGFKQALLVNSEWETSLVPSDTILGGDAGRAAFTAEGLIYMQDAPVDRAASYMNIGSKLSKENHAFEMVATLKTTPVRLAAQGGNNEGFAVLAGRSDAKQEMRVVIANYELSPTLMGPIEGGNDYVLKSDLGTTLATFTLLDRRTITYPKREGYALTVTNVPQEWGDVTVKQYRVDASNDMKLMNTVVSKAAERAQGSLNVSGSWVHATANPPSDPDGADQGVDLIVLAGSGQ